MTTITLGDLRTGLKQALERIPGLHASATEPPQVRFPAAWPELQSWPDAEDFDGNTVYTFSIFVMVQAGEINRAQTALDAYRSRAGVNSVRQALLADPSLGLGDSVRLMGVRGLDLLPKPMNVAGANALGCRFECDVRAP